MGKSLFVGNLSYNTTEEGLAALFESEGFNVVKAKVVLDRDTGRPRGFAFVDLETDDVTPVVEMLNGRDLDGRQLNIREAHDRGPRPQGGRGGGGGGFGGGGGGGFGGGGGGGGRRDGGGGGGGGFGGGGGGGRGGGGGGGRRPPRGDGGGGRRDRDRD